MGVPIDIGSYRSKPAPLPGSWAPAPRRWVSKQLLGKREWPVELPLPLHTIKRDRVVVGVIPCSMWAAVTTGNTSEQRGVSVLSGNGFAPPQRAPANSAGLLVGARVAVGSLLWWGALPAQTAPQSGPPSPQSARTSPLRRSVLC